MFYALTNFGAAWTHSPCTSWSASINPSDKLGCACIISPTCSTVRPKPTAKDNSVNKSVAWGPTIEAPMILSLLSARTFINPWIWPIAWAFPNALKSNWPTLYCSPAAWSCFSVFPTPATSGSVYTHLGTAA